MPTGTIRVRIKKSFQNNDGPMGGFWDEGTEPLLIDAKELREYVKVNPSLVELVGPKKEKKSGGNE